MQTWLWIGQSAFDTLLLVNIVVIWYAVRRLPTKLKAPSDLGADISVLESKAFQLEKEMEHYRRRVLLQINALNHICETANQILEKSRSKNPLSGDFHPSVFDPKTGHIEVNPVERSESESTPKTAQLPVTEASATVRKLTPKDSATDQKDNQEWGVTSSDRLRQQLG